MFNPMHAIPRKTMLVVLGGACLAAVILAGVSRTATARASAATAPPVDHQLCYTAAGVFKVPTHGVTLFDQFNPNGFAPKVINPHANLLCNPVIKSLPTGAVLSKVTNPRAHLVCYPMTASDTTAPPPKVQVTNQFGQGILAPARNPNGLCVPSWKSLTGKLAIKPTTPPRLNHFTCYPVSLVSGGYKPPAGLLLRDEFTKKNVKVTVNPVPQALCLPAMKTITIPKKPTQKYPIINPDQHLLCYAVTKTPIRNPVWAENQFGSTQMRVVRTKWLCVPSTKKVVPADCNPSSSLNVLTQGTNVVAYVPKGSWSVGSTGVSAVNVEGSSIVPTLIPTASVVNSCASNSLSGETVCTGNDASVYEINGTSLTTTVTSGGTSFIGFSGGSCTNCGIAMDALHNRAVIGLSDAAVPSFQFLNLGTNVFGSMFASQTSPTAISEDPLIDPTRNLLLSANEYGTYELIDISNPASPKFYENVTGQIGEMDSSAEDCSTGIALAPEEFTGPSTIYIADLTQATLTAGSPAGTWSAPSQQQPLSNSNLSAGPTGIGIAQGTHTGVVTGEFGGDQITAIRLPATSGSGTPAIQDWVSCQIPSTPTPAPWSEGYDPHTVAAYKSPTSGDAIALMANFDFGVNGPNWLARVDLTKMLNTGVVPRTTGDICTSGTLPPSVVSFIAVP